MADDTKISGMHLLLIGGGPRSVLQLNGEIAFAIIYKSHFEELMRMGAHYQIETTILEKATELGCGGAFSLQTGMVNSPVEEDITFPLQLPVSSALIDSMKHSLSYKRRYEEMLLFDKEAYYKKIKGSNLPGAIMFRRSVGPMSTTPDGLLDHNRAYLMRKTVGEEECENLNKMLNIAEKELPFYRVSIQSSTEVRGIVINNKFLTALVSGKGSKQQSISANLIRLNTGTVSRNPISDLGVGKLTFCQPMNVEDFRSFCSDLRLLHHDGLLRPGVRLLCGGTGLSGLDQISILDGIMNLFEEDVSSWLGYRVREEAKKKYIGAITFVNRTSGKVCPPRHAYSCEWKQGTPVIGTTKHLHALFLHRSGEHIHVWIDIIKAAVARATNRVPKNIQPNCSTEEAVRMQFQETTKFLKYRQMAGISERRGDLKGKERCSDFATRTLFGAWRQAALAFAYGLGMERDPAAAVVEMSRTAPITWKGRDGFLLHRGHRYSISNVDYVTEKSNTELCRSLEMLMSHVTGAPVEMHSMFHLLFEAGIAKYVQAAYKGIQTSSDGRFLILKGKLYDAFLVSPVFERKRDEVAKSLARQVRPLLDKEPTYGKIGKFRRFVGIDGRPVSVEDNGLSGCGFKATTTNGEESVFGMHAPDVTNRSSAASTVSSFTLRRMALTHLSAAGVPAPEEVLDKIYEEGKADQDEYDKEVLTFAGHFESAYEIWAYLKAIENIACRDATLYRRLYDAGCSAKGRHAAMQKALKNDDSRYVQAAQQYNRDVAKTPKFVAPSRDQYLDRFVDITDDEAAHLYNEARKKAKQHLAMKSRTRK